MSFSVFVNIIIRFEADFIVEFYACEIAGRHLLIDNFIPLCSANFQRLIHGDRAVSLPATTRKQLDPDRNDAL